MAFSSAAQLNDSSGDEDDSIPTSTESSTYEIASSGSSCLFQEVESLAPRGDLVGQKRSCCCVSAEELTAHWMDQPMTGWQARNIESPSSGKGSVGPSHCISAQLSDKYLSSLSDTAGYFSDGVSQLFKSNSSTGRIFKSSQTLSRGVISLGSESKSSLRNYIYSSPAIPYTFHHHVNASDGDAGSVYMEEYRRAYTYPSLQERNKRIPETISSLSTTVKPTLFVLHNDIRHPLYYKKKQVRISFKCTSHINTPFFYTG